MPDSRSPRAISVRESRTIVRVVSGSSMPSEAINSSQLSRSCKLAAA